MDDDVKPGEGEQKPAEGGQEPVQKEPQYSEIELRAMEMGWRPKEEFNGEEDDFIDAKEFVRRKPLFDKIENTTKEVKNLRKALDALKGHYTKVQEAEYNRALAKLKEARQEAITNSDGEAFTQIDNQINEVEQQMQEVKRVQQQTEEPVIHPEFTAWVNRNPWYSNSPGMRSFADEVGVKLHAQGLQPAEVLREVEKAVRKEFPHKFRNPNKDSAEPVGNSKQGQGKGNSSDNIELTEQERKVMNMLVSTKTMTKEEYLKGIKAIRGSK